MFSKKTMDSFSSKYEINPDTQCWEWTASYARGGYGQFFTSILDGRQWHRAHRFSYIAHKGEIPDDCVVMHTCDNPKCVNPDHLITGTQADNIKDRDGKNRGHWCKSFRAIDVRSIKDSHRSDRELASEFNCSPGHIWKIRNDRYAWVRNRAGREVL